MNFERGVVISCLLWILFIAILAPLMILTGNMDIARFALILLFFGGSICSVVGYLRYMPAGPKAPALLPISIIKNVAFSFMGLAFLVSLLFQPNVSAINVPLLITYSFFGMAGAVISFVGAFLVIGAGRGWISREVYKNPFHRSKEESRDDE